MSQKNHESGKEQEKPIDKMLQYCKASAAVLQYFGKNDKFRFIAMTETPKEKFSESFWAVWEVKQLLRLPFGVITATT